MSFSNVSTMHDSTLNLISPIEKVINDEVLFFYFTAQFESQKINYCPSSITIIDQQYSNFLQVSTVDSLGLLSAISYLIRHKDDNW